MKTKRTGQSAGGKMRVGFAQRWFVQQSRPSALTRFPGSPAMNAGDPNFVPPPLYDQRGPGFDRVRGGRIDIGSFEVQETAPTRTSTPRVTPTPRRQPTPRSRPTQV